MGRTKSRVWVLAYIIIVIALVAFAVIQYQRRRSHEAAIVTAGGTQTKRGTRRITAPRFARRASGAKIEAAKEESPDTEASEAEVMPVPEEVPTAQSTDDEIREFLAWLSNLDAEDTAEETEMEDSSAVDSEANHERESSLIQSVIWDQWKRGYETYDIERYMSAIWEDDFFYTSDIGTPDDPSDDAIIRGGQQERESAARVFSRFTKSIELNLSPRSDIEFLSDTIAMAEYDYEAKFSRIPTPEDRFEMIYTSGKMTIILERRGNSGDTSEWRILEWYDHATPK
jgi:hypothetical protein